MKSQLSVSRPGRRHSSVDSHRRILELLPLCQSSDQRHGSLFIIHMLVGLDTAVKIANIPCMKSTTWSMSFRLPASARLMMENRVTEADPRPRRRAIFGDCSNKLIEAEKAGYPIHSASLKKRKRFKHILRLNLSYKVYSTIYIYIRSEWPLSCKCLSLFFCIPSTVICRSQCSIEVSSAAVPAEPLYSIVRLNNRIYIQCRIYYYPSEGRGTETGRSVIDSGGQMIAVGSEACARLCSIE